jgi:hypothetical protein
MRSVTLIMLRLSLTIVSHAQTSLFTYNSSWKYPDKR